LTSKNKARGYALEAETVKHWQGLGAECKRVFASGAYKDYLPDKKGDLMLAGFIVECKRKKSGFRFLYKSLKQDDADILVIRQDALPGQTIQRLYVMPEETVEALMRQAGVIK
tara:strand:+ start:239 stop:577 length:339 start_codon:yes stop_codon:yes gene_type:complete